MSPLRRLAPETGPAPSPSGSRRATRTLARVLVVLFLAVVGLTGLGSGVASAGFECKEVPRPEYPNEVLQTVVDSDSANQPAIQNGTGYETYGWAGLKWHTYDLGCGADLVRAPSAVGDTSLGNVFLSIGKTFAAAAFWLDGQTKTGAAAARAGIDPALEKFDRIVISVSSAVGQLYGQWVGIGLIVVASMVLWKALRGDAAGITKTSGVAAAGLALGALMIGAPQKALEVADNTFGSLITETQDQIFSMSFGEGEEQGTLSGGRTDPKNVLIDRIFLEDWRKGWFGTNYDKDDKAELGPKLRDSLAFSYAEQQQVSGDPKAADELATQKGKVFEEIVKSLGDDFQLSYQQFQGKDSGRTSIGFMAMLKLAMPSLLWIGASLLKLTALMAIRFAVLFAPIWIPVAIAYASWMGRIMRMLASAYMWGVAGSVIVALYLMALVQLYVTDDGGVDGSWRLWFMAILTVVCWVIMRPFKRMSQTFTQNSASMVNRKARNAKKSIKRKAFDAASFAIGGPSQAIAEKAVGGVSSVAGKGKRTATDGAESVSRPEGRALNSARQQSQTQARVEARKAQGSRAGRLSQAGAMAADRDARIAGIAALASRDVQRGKGGVDSREAEHAAQAGVSARQRSMQADSDEKRQDRKARKELLTAGAGQKWDGGNSSAIAPMKVYTPRRTPTAPSSSSPRTSSSPRIGSSTSSAPRSENRYV